MIRITRDSKYAPCGYLVIREPFDKYDEKNTILIQSDWDFPGVARTFGWDMTKEQILTEACDHSGTDGTVPCPDCGISVSQMIEAAQEYLDTVLDEKEVEDPGYFADA